MPINNNNGVIGGNSNSRMDKMLAGAEVDNITRGSKSRSKIAFLFAISFVVISAIIIVGSLIYNLCVPIEKMTDIDRLLTSFGSLFGTSLRFVLGYYFKDKK